MAQQPAYPNDAKVGDEAITTPNSNEPVNETLSHAITAKQAKERSAGKEEGSSLNRKLIKGAAIGIGSAAVVAALIYARKTYYSSGDED